VEPKMLTRAEAADYLGVSTTYLANAAWRGDGPTLIRIGHRTIRYRRDTLETWLAARTISPLQPRTVHALG
jgi:predicted DNA-binding transcriptional regulator AlpA